MKIRIRNIDINVLLFSLPAFTCLVFFINALAHTSVQIGSYFNLCLTIYLFNKIIKVDKNTVILSSVSLFFVGFLYAIFLGTHLNESFSYLVTFFNIVFMLNYLPDCDFSEVDVKKFRKHLTWFVILFIIFYELSVPFAQVRDSDEDFYDVHRVYKEGFEISHAACYYLGVAGFFLYLMRQRLLAILVWAYVFSLGARVGIIYVIIAIIVLIIRSFPKIYNLIVKFRYLVLLALIIITTIIVQVTISRIGLEGLMVFTSGRSIFWLKAIGQITDDGFSFLNIFGRGPRYSNSYNKRYFNVEVWMHNDFFDVAFNLGIVGIIIYLGSFYNYFKKSRSLLLFFVFLVSESINGFLVYDALFIITLSTLFSKKNIAV